MAIKSDKWIRKMALEHGMIEPFEDRQVRHGVVSYGVSSYGYDCRVGNEFKVFTNVYNTVVDPKHFDPQSFVDIKADCCIVPPNSFALASTVEASANEFGGTMHSAALMSTNDCGSKFFGSTTVL